MNVTDSRAETERLRELSRRQIRAGQFDAAEVSLQSLLHAAPDDVRACIELAGVRTRNGRWIDSAEPLLQAAAHLKPDAPLVLELARELIARGEIVAARDCLAFLARAPQPPMGLLWSQAGLRYLLGEIAPANDLLERALEAGADDADCHYLHGLLLKFLGQLERAEEVLGACMRRWPDLGDAMVQLVELRGQTQAHDAERLARVDARLNDALPPGADRHARFNHAQFQYARFKILDDQGRCEQAWPALQACNQAMHAARPYQPSATTAIVDALLRVPLSADDGAPVAASPDQPVPIFIVGMPRSGTTLLEQMLSAHSQIASAGEILDFERQLRVLTNVLPGHPQGMVKAIDAAERVDWPELGARYLRQTAWRANGRRFLIDKLPANIRMLAFIRRALPQARILHMVRDPMDVCFSNFKAMFGSGSPYSYELDAVAHYYRQYRRLLAHWHEHLPGAMLDVPYAALVDDPDALMRDVLAHCDLQVEAACLHPERNRAPVATPSSAQVREPVHRRGLGAWRRYEAELQPLKDALGELARAD